MKKLNWLMVLLILLSLGTLYGYRTLAAVKADTEVPEIHMSSQIPEISVQDPKTALFQGITVNDRRDGDVTDFLVVEAIELLDNTGRLNVRYAAFDRSGNVAKAQREAKYTDYKSPYFTMGGPLLYRYGSDFDVLRTVGASDVIDGDIQHRIRATSLTEKSIAEMGVHEVRFQVTNSLGDTVTKVFPVEVYDGEMYEASLSLKQYIVYLKLGSTFSAKDYLKTFSLAREDTDLSKGLPANYTLKTEGTVQTQNPGIYPVEFRVTYTERHETDRERDREYTGYSKMIVVVEG